MTVAGFQLLVLGCSLQFEISCGFSVVNNLHNKFQLAEGLEKQKDTSLFKADTPSKENIETPKLETHFAGVKKEGLQPTPEEKKEYDFTKDYNPRVESAIEEIKRELQKGNTDVNVSAIMEKNGFKEGKDRFIYSNGQLQIGIPKINIERPIKDVKEQFERFKDIEKQHSELMQQEPKKITVFDKLTGSAKEKENANYSLQREKREAVKPKFNPQVREMESRYFTATSKFENRKYEYKRQEQLKEMFSHKNEHEQTRKRGLSR